MSHLLKAKDLLNWNTVNLVHDADLQKTDLQKLFAKNFKVIANDKQYDANYDNYYDFLNTFRASIKSISYDVDDYIESPNHVVMPLKAHIIRINGETQSFTAILILKFDNDGLITLWHEVYVELLEE